MRKLRHLRQYVARGVKQVLKVHREEGVSKTKTKKCLRGMGLSHQEVSILLGEKP